MRLPIAALLAFACYAAVAQDAPSLRARMSAQDFHQAGLDKLTAQELGRLEHWLATHASDPAPALPASEAHSARAAAHQPQAPRMQRKSEAVNSRLAGQFNGWHRGSVLVLQNGQQWRVVDTSELIVPQALDRPAVTVRPGLLGGWNLQVEGYNTRARVEPAN